MFSIPWRLFGAAGCYLLLIFAPYEYIHVWTINWYIHKSQWVWNAAVGGEYLRTSGALEMYDVVTGSPTQWFDLKSLGQFQRLPRRNFLISWLSWTPTLSTIIIIIIMTIMTTMITVVTSMTIGTIKNNVTTWQLYHGYPRNYDDPCYHDHHQCKPRFFFSSLSFLFFLVSFLFFLDILSALVSLAHMPTPWKRSC